jgi:peptide/nickel transport system permease protein
MSVTVSEPITEQAGASRPKGLRHALLASGRVRVGVILTGGVLLVAFVGPFVAPSTTRFAGVPFAQPGTGGLLGTDYLGHNVLGPFLDGGVSLIGLSAAATLLCIVVGAPWGIVAGYRGGWRDEGLMRLADLLLALPQIVFALLFLSILGAKLWLLVLVVGLTQAPRVARVMRAATLSVTERNFIKAAEAIGTPRWKIVFNEILPNVISPLMVEVGLRLTFSIGLVASLSFLGLGVQPPASDWGLMINENRSALTVQPWPVVLPVIMIAMLTVGINLLTDGFARAAIGIDRGVEQ